MFSEMIKGIFGSFFVRMDDWFFLFSLKNVHT